LLVRLTTQFLAFDPDELANPQKKIEHRNFFPHWCELTNDCRNPASWPVPDHTLQ
jgi:hypothetical protein